MSIITQTSHPSAIYGQNDIVLIGGCWDLFHIGHLNLLNSAKMLGGQLEVAVLSDRYIRAYKGPTRPIIEETARLAIVQAIRAVHSAWVTDISPSSPSILTRLMPRALVFGIEQKANLHEKSQQRAARIQQQFPSIDIHFFPRFLPEQIATTKIISKIRELE